jgi:hypothetical protein
MPRKNNRQGTNPADLPAKSWHPLSERHVRAEAEPAVPVTQSKEYARASRGIKCVGAPVRPDWREALR